VPRAYGGSASGTLFRRPVSHRIYPARPIVGVGGVIVDGDRVVLIKRKYEPLAGRWSLPGGTLLVVRVGPVVEVFDRILRDEDGRVKYHFVLVDYLCLPVGGSLQAGDDASDAKWVGFGDLAAYDLTVKATEVLRRAEAMPRDW
jgi:8-oxo-dGTP diphosphatase